MQISLLTVIKVVFQHTHLAVRLKCFIRESVLRHLPPTFHQKQGGNHQHVEFLTSVWTVCSVGRIISLKRTKRTHHVGGLHTNLYKDS